MPSYAQWFVNECSRAARNAFQMMTLNGSAEAIYLYGRRGQLVPSYSTPDPEGGERFQLVTGERIPSDRTVEGINAWIYDKARRFPCLPNE